jgi:hypothetical protein
MPRTFLRIALGGVLLIAGAALVRQTFFRGDPVTVATAPTEDALDDPLPPDPRLTFSTPFRNIRPEIRYVGDAKCAACHGDICTSYHAHPMGRSASSGTSVPIEQYGAGANNPFSIAGYELRAEKTADGALHRVRAKGPNGEPLPDYTVAADVAIGSGTRGRSYLSVEGGTVWQSPLSWYSSAAKWDLSPGFDLGSGGRRAIVPECLFCHADRVEPVPKAVNRYREPLFAIQAAIGCERCHGPGELHVAERTAGKADAKVDTSIVNPKHLSNALQMSICAQCHLQGEERVTRRGRSASEFRPGLPFEEFVSVFVRHPDIVDMSRSVGQFEQLGVSKCTTADGGRILCTSCHDPHKVPAASEKDRHYRAKCQTCHETKPCKAPAPERAAKADNCTACHMPKAGSTNIAHTSVTDHRIQRRPVATPPGTLIPGTVPLVPFHAGPSDAPLERDLGIALARLASKVPPGSGQHQFLARLARERLGTSLETWKADTDAWLALSLALRGSDDPAERLKAAERALKLAPESEAALAEVVDAALATEGYARAESAADTLIALNPKSVDALLLRATSFTLRKQWEPAERDCRAALKIHPLHAQARLVLALCLHGRGDADAAKREAETAIGLVIVPAQKSAFRAWFLQQAR